MKNNGYNLKVFLKNKNFRVESNVKPEIIIKLQKFNYNVVLACFSATHSEIVINGI